MNNNIIVFRDGPNIIYTKEMQLQQAFANKHKEYIEDLENGYDRIATLHYQKREHDNDSIRRHEIDRGSEVGVFLKSDDRKLHEKSDGKGKDRAPSSLGRDQYFIKEGNTEILRLVTRGKNEEERYVNLPTHQQQRPVTLIPHTQYVVVDSGKDLLMERFIREQGEEAKNIRERMEKVTDLDMPPEKDGKSFGQRSQAGSDIPNNYHDYNNVHLDVPGSIPLRADYLQSALLEMQNKSSIHQELLESSLRKQNELLHQILIERERLMQNHETASQVESKLETQSLPGHSVMATQTECHIGTQTEPEINKPTRRKARSDNDSYSEDDSEMIVEDDTAKVAWVKRKKPKKKLKYKDPRRSMRAYEVKRKIKTPIIEESEISPSLESEKHVKISKTNEREEHIKNYGDITKSTVTTSKNETVSSTRIKMSESDRKSGLRKELLMEISDSLDEKVESELHDRRQRLHRQSSVSIEEAIEKNEPLALEHESYESKSRASSASKNNLNLIFSRQGSSTEAREKLGMSPVKLKSPDLDDSLSKKDSSSNTESNNKKTDGESSKGESSKPAQKSLPRYMQWYGNKKSSSTASKPESKISEKLAPNKPKRPSKTKKDIEKEEKDKTARYGKIINKENETSEAKKNFKGKESEFIHPRLLKEEKVTPVPEGPLPDSHPLLQHSEHRYEHQYENQNPLCHIQPTHIPKYLVGQPDAMPRKQSLEQQPIYVNQDEVKKTKQDISESALTHSISISTSYEEDRKNAAEVHVSKINIGGDNVPDISHRNVTSKVDDNDSGIAMNTLAQQTGNIKRLPITEKKSIFTIAYDDVQTKQLRPDSSSTSY